MYFFYILVTFCSGLKEWRKDLDKTKNLAFFHGKTITAGCLIANTQACQKAPNQRGRVH